MYDSLVMRSPIAAWIYEFRVRLDLTQRQLAEALDTAHPTVKAWEQGRQVPRGPTMLLLRRMAHDIGFHDPPPVVQPRKENQTNDL